MGGGGSVGKWLGGFGVIHFENMRFFFRYYSFDRITRFLCNFLIIKLAFRHCNLDLIRLQLLNTDLRQNQHWNVFGVECAEQKNASATPTSWWSNPKRPASFKAPLRVRPKQNNTRKNIKIVNYRVFSRLTFLNYTSERIGRVFFLTAILDLPQLRGCLSVVRGTWNRPCPMSSVVFLLSPGFSMLLEKKWGLYLD